MSNKIVFINGDNSQEYDAKDIKSEDDIKKAFKKVMKESIYRIIRTNNTIEEHPYGKNQLTFKEVYPQIKADTIEIISLSDSLEMWVDEKGQLTDKRYNETATELVKVSYVAQGLRPIPKIVGDVAVVDKDKRD